MSNTVISVENLSKAYRLGQIGTGTISHDLNVWWAKVRGKPNPLLRIGETDHGNRAGEELWALRDVSFTVGRGEVLGIIGRNGAGKSTLLKILSRVTAPTNGHVKVKGRIASLLEVGTGFHQDLTGRENTYLNGAILGMSRKEVDRKFDEIVDFAEIEKFIDTPVKRYSSGMYVRLAFAVAAHLEPEILLVDEVLAVGDADFQKKCLGKMSDVASGGRTVLFVSHNMSAVNTLCGRAIWINGGVIVQNGTAPKIVSSYLTHASSVIGYTAWPENERPGDSMIKLISVSMKNSSGVLASEINISDEALIEIEYEVILSGARALWMLLITDTKDNLIFSTLSNTQDNIYHSQPLQVGRYLATCVIEGNLLNDGRYYVSVLGNSGFGNNDFPVQNSISFDALDDGLLRNDYHGRFPGMVRPKLVWHTTALDS